VLLNGLRQRGQPACADPARALRLPCGGPGRWPLARGKAAHGGEPAAGFDGRAAGVALAQFGIAALLRAAPENLPRLPKCIWTAQASVRRGGSGGFERGFRTGAAWQASRIEVTEALKQGGSRGVVDAVRIPCGTR